MARSLALEIISKYCKHTSKEELITILTNILEYPEKHKTNEVWGKLAEHFTPTIIDKQFSVYDLLDTPLPFKTYGGKFIDSLAK